MILKVSKYKLWTIGFLLFLMICSYGNVILQVAAISVFGLITIIFKGINKNFYFLGFYISLILLSLSQLLLFWRSDYSIPFVVNTLLITMMWVLAFLAHNIIISSVKILTVNTLKRCLDYFFVINAVLVIYQYFDVCIQAKTLFPFSTVEFGMSTGDYLKGFFVNSSVNMVIMAFYTVYYLMKRNKRRTIAAIVIGLLTTYMSGILVALGIVSFYGFFKFKLANKGRIIGAIAVMFIAFSVFSPENLDYIGHIFTEKLNSKTDPPRKLVSFKETATNFVSSPSSFLFGEGGGKFSSRVAYMTGGEYVSWFPENLVYRSEKFENNHFKLWNYKALSISFRDGTSNQPFSFYNKIVGEYGFIGILLFLLYLSYYFKRYHYLTYGRLILLILLGFLILDYWYEYFTLMLFFEIFMFLNIKEQEEFVSLNPK